MEFIAIGFGPAVAVGGVAAVEDIEIPAGANGDGGAPRLPRRGGRGCIGFGCVGVGAAGAGVAFAPSEVAGTVLNEAFGL